MLYDQYDNAGTVSTNSQDYEARATRSTTRLADDFVGPERPGLERDGRRGPGHVRQRPGPAASVQRARLRERRRQPARHAGRSERPNQTFTGGPSFVVTLSPSIGVLPGTYWLSVQADQSFADAGQWGWTNRTVQANVRRRLAEPGRRPRRLPGLGAANDLPAGDSRTPPIRCSGSPEPLARHLRHRRRLRLHRHRLHRRLRLRHLPPPPPPPTATASASATTATATTASATATATSAATATATATAPGPMPRSTRDRDEATAREAGSEGALPSGPDPSRSLAARRPRHRAEPEAGRRQGGRDEGQPGRRPALELGRRALFRTRSLGLRP